MTWESETRGGEDIHMRKGVAVVMGDGLHRRMIKSLSILSEMVTSCLSEKEVSKKRKRGAGGMG